MRGFATIFLLIIFLIFVTTGIGLYKFWSNKQISKVASIELKSSEPKPKEIQEKEVLEIKENYKIVSLNQQTLAGTILLHNGLPVVLSSSGPQLYFCETETCEKITDEVRIFEIYSNQGSANTYPIPYAKTSKGEYFFAFFGAKDGETGLYTVL